MLIRFLILAVLWLAIFRFVGRVLRYLAGSGAGSTYRSTGVGSGTDPSRRSPREAHTGWSGPTPPGGGQVIDVDYEDLTPGGRSQAPSER